MTNICTLLGRFRVTLRLFLCLSLLSALPSAVMAQASQARKKSESPGKPARNSDRAASPQWMKSSHRGWVAVPNGAKPPATVRLASLKSQEGGPESPVPSVPVESQEPAANTAPTVTPDPVAVEQPPAEAIPQAIEKSETQPAPAFDATETKSADNASAPSTATNTRANIGILRDQLKAKLLNDADNNVPNSVGLSTNDQDSLSDDPYRRERASELKKLQERIQFLIDQQKRMRPNTPPPAPNPVQTPPVVEPNQVPAPGPEKSGTKTELHPPAPKPDKVPVPTPVHPPQPHQTPDQHEEEKSWESESGPHPPEPHPKPDDTGHSTEHPPVISDAPETTTVQGTIDHLRLANNLFAMGNFELALEVYAEADASTLTPQQQFWVEYQQASCLRRMGRSAEASNRYRRLADKPEAGSLSELSQWWVTTLEKKRQLEKQLGISAQNSAPGQHSPADPHATEPHGSVTPLKSTPKDHSETHVSRPAVSADEGHATDHNDHKEDSHGGSKH